MVSHLSLSVLRLPCQWIFVYLPLQLLLLCVTAPVALRGSERPFPIVEPNLTFPYIKKKGMACPLNVDFSFVSTQRPTGQLFFLVNSDVGEEGNRAF